MSLRNRMRWPRVCGAPALVAAIFATSAVALAQETDPYQEEWSDVFGADRPSPSGNTEVGPGGSAPFEPDAEDEEEGGEEAVEEPGRGRMQEEGRRGKTGAEARRELLFRDGLDEREFRYPEGLDPAPPVSRSGQGVFDARYRGRNAQVLRETPAGLSVGAGVSAGLLIDSNPQLLSDEEAGTADRGAWGWFVEPSLAVARRTPKTLFQGVIRLPYDEFHSFEGDLNDDLGSFDQHAGLQMDVFGRENAFNLFTNISNSTRRTALVEETGEELTGDRVLTYGGGGSFKHTLTPDSVVQFSAAARRQDLEDDNILFDDIQDGSDLEDSTYYQLALDFRKLVSLTDAAGLGAIYEEFLPEGSFSRDVRIITALANWSRDVSSSMSFLFEAGAQIITGEEIEGFVPSDTSIGPFIETSFYWAATPKDSFLFTYGHSADPTAAGEVRINDRVEIVYNRVLSRRLSLGVPLLVLFQNESVSEGFESRTFVQFSPNLVWVFHPSWGLSLEYRFRLDNDEESSGATSNAAFLSLNYFGQLVP